MRTTKTSDRSSIKGSSSSSSTNTRASDIPGVRSRKGTSGARTPESRSSNRTIPGARVLSGISNRQLLSGIRKLSETERKTVLSILVHLIEIDRRRLYLEMGYSSLFELCIKDLGYSESVAGRRISVARCIRKFPLAYRALASGKVNLTNLGMVTRIITAGNAREILSAVAGASKKDVGLLVSRHRPRSAIRDSVTPVYVRTEIRLSNADRADDPDIRRSKSLDGRAGTTPTSGSGKSPNSEDLSSGGGPAAATESGRGPVSTELQVVLEERLRITFGADPGFMKKVQRIRALLSSKHHGWIEFEELFSILMDEYIERHSPEGRIRRKSRREQKKIRKESNNTARISKDQKTARTDEGAGASKDQKTASQTVKGDSKTKDPRARQKPEQSRYIPQKVRDEVYARDRGCCTFVAPGGRRCGSKWDLQIDHKVPFARGGDNSPENLRLLCGKHNRLEAERAYGKKHMEKYSAKKMEKYIKESGERYWSREVIHDEWRSVKIIRAPESRIFLYSNRPHIFLSRRDSRRITLSGN